MRRRILPIMLFAAVSILALAPPVASIDAGRNDEPDVVRVRALFENRQFPDLTDLPMKYQASCEEDVRREYAVIDAFSVFGGTTPSYKTLLDEWVQVAPESWVPWLARASYYSALGGEARGTNWAKDTSEEQFRRMNENFLVAARDAETARPSISVTSPRALTFLKSTFETFATPLANAYIDSDRVTVTGSYTSYTSAIGIAVNGVPATVSGSGFTALDVPLAAEAEGDDEQVIGAATRAGGGLKPAARLSPAGRATPTKGGIGMMPKMVSCLAMTQRRKLIDKARNNPAGVRFQELCVLAEHLGFTRRGGKGSHIVYEKDGVKEILTFQDRKGMAKPYQVKQLLAVIEKYRLGERA